MDSIVEISHHGKNYAIHLNRRDNYRTFAAFDHVGEWIAKGSFDDDNKIELVSGSLPEGSFEKFKAKAYEQVFKVTQEDRFAAGLIKDAFHFKKTREITRIDLSQIRDILSAWLANPVRSNLSQLRKSLIYAEFRITPDIDVTSILKSED